MKKISFTLLILFFTLVNWSQQATTENFESNGLKGDLKVHDPVMIKDGDWYYVFGTGLSSKKSTDKINWINDNGVFAKGEV
jgi:hypothetical protein